jgi:hypothetical protein
MAWSLLFSLSQTEVQADAGFSNAGLTSTQADEVENSLMAIPSVHMAAHCVVDGEDASTDIMETDIVTCAVRVVLTRHSHLAAGEMLFLTALQLSWLSVQGKVSYLKA